MPGGINNPRSAPSALYLYRDGRDNDVPHPTAPTSRSRIGHAMSSGCVRMLNHDVIDLHERVPTGARVVVMQA